MTRSHLEPKTKEGETRYPLWLNRYKVKDLKRIAELCEFDESTTNGPPWPSKMTELCSDEDLLYFHFCLDLHLWIYLEQDQTEFVKDTSKWPKEVFDYWDFIQMPEVLPVIHGGFDAIVEGE